LLKKLFGEKEVPQAPLTRYKVTFNFADQTNHGRQTKITVPNATHYETFISEGLGFAHMICVERDVQVWIESQSQTLVSFQAEVVRG
jgi:hypothetical protein